MGKYLGIVEMDRSDSEIEGAALYRLRLSFLAKCSECGSNRLAGEVTFSLVGGDDSDVVVERLRAVADEIEKRCAPVEAEG